MSTHIRLIMASLACFGLIGAAGAQSRDDWNRTGGLYAQREELPPAWSIGNWAGRNEERHTDVTLSIEEDGRASMTITLGTNRQSFRGAYRDGALDFGGARYQIQQSGERMLLSEVAGRRYVTELRRVGGRPLPGGGALAITSPQAGARIRSGMVHIEGTTSDPEVQIEVFRDRDRIARQTVPVRNGRYSTDIRLDDRGRYDLTVRTRGRGRQSSERTVSFEIGGAGIVSIEEPRDGRRYAEGMIQISGLSESRDVEIEINHGRDRIFITRVSTNVQGRFATRTNLTSGHYVITARSMDNGQVMRIDRQAFDVGRGDVNDRVNDLRLDRPQVSGNSVDFQGATDAREVRLEIFSGRDRIYNDTLQVRDGRFRSRVQLPRGRYEAVATVDTRGRESMQRRVTFEVR